MNAHTVLLVDPDPDSLNIYSLMLEHRGFRVLLAHEGEAAFRLASEESPDLVITEVHVRVAAGISLAEQLKRTPRTAHLPILAVTSFPVRSGRDAAGLAACDGQLAKPCSPSRLLQEVERWTGGVPAEPIPVA